VSLTILVVAGTLDCAFVKVLAVPVAFASALPLNMATAIVRNMPASRVVLPTLSLLIVLAFMMVSFGFGWWFVLRLLMWLLYGRDFLLSNAFRRIAKIAARIEAGGDDSNLFSCEHRATRVVFST
jgi:hypothetical protein